MPSKVVIETVKLIWNNNSEITHAIAEGYAVTRCGIWYNMQYQEKYSVHYHVPGTEPTCKSCRKAIGLTPKVSATYSDKNLLKDCLRIMKKSGGFVKDAPIFIRLEKAIKREKS